MNPISAFFVRNIITVFFFYGLGFFTMGLALAPLGPRPHGSQGVSEEPAYEAGGHYPNPSAKPLRPLPLGGES